MKLIASRWSKKLASTKSHDYFKVSRQRSEVDELTDMVNALRGNEKAIIGLLKKLRTTTA